eukprot:1158529-Pelagomonas_calceolata.AAC.16
MAAYTLAIYCALQTCPFAYRDYMALSTHQYMHTRFFFRILTWGACFHNNRSALAVANWLSSCTITASRGRCTVDKGSSKMKIRSLLHYFA